MSALRTITEAELALHNSYTDLWVAIENKVYNLTEFQMEHPGGSDILVEVAGRDATDEFEDAAHSEDAYEMMNSYLVGVLEGQFKPKPKPTAAKSSGSSFSAKYFVYGGLAIGTAAIIAYLLMKQRNS